MAGYSSVYGPADPYGTDMGAASMGMPTVNTSAAVAGAGNTGVASAGIAPPTAAGAPPVVAPGVAGVAGAKTGPGFFGEGGFASMALGAIQTLGSLWNSFQQNKLAKESLAFQKQGYAENMANTKSSYNTALQDRINSRYVTEGKSQAEADAYINKNKL